MESLPTVVGGHGPVESLKGRKEYVGSLAAAV